MTAALHRLAGLLLLLLCLVSSTGCASTQALNRPASFSGLALHEQASQTTVDAAIARAAACLAVDATLPGWTVWVVADSRQCIQGQCFNCPANARAECGPPPPGYTDETAPCECAGLTNLESRRIALTPNLSAINHELLHAFGLVHADADFKRCNTGP